MELARICAGFDRWSVRPAPPGDDPQAVRSRRWPSCADEVYAGMAVNGIVGARRRRDLGQAAGLRLVRVPRVALGELRLHRLHVGLAEATTGPPSSSAGCSTPSRWGSTAPTRWSRTPAITGWWCSLPTSTAPGTTAPSSTWDADPDDVVSYLRERLAAGEGAGRRRPATGGGGADRAALRAQPGRGGDHADRGGRANRWRVPPHRRTWLIAPGSRSTPSRRWPLPGRWSRSGSGAGRGSGRRG